MIKYFQLDYNSIKEILHDCSKTLDSSNNYVGTDDLIIQFIDNLLQENKKYKEVIDTIKNILNNQMNYREFVDIVNAIEDVVKEVE